MKKKLLFLPKLVQGKSCGDKQYQAFNLEELVTSGGRPELHLQHDTLESPLVKQVRSNFFHPISVFFQCLVN